MNKRVQKPHIIPELPQMPDLYSNITMQAERRIEVESIPNPKQSEGNHVSVESEVFAIKVKTKAEARISGKGCVSKRKNTKSETKSKIKFYQ